MNAVCRRSGWGQSRRFDVTRRLPVYPGERTFFQIPRHLAKGPQAASPDRCQWLPGGFERYLDSLTLAARPVSP